MKENLKNQKHFLAAMYLRLSREDDVVQDSNAAKRGGIAKCGDTADAAGVKFESNSITSQRELIRAYIQKQPDIELYDIYVDDGFSGSSFERPEFKRMMCDVQAGRVNCIIVKDLSRFGRDYIESGRYIQKIFPALGVRFIALTDHFDSLCADAGESGIVLPVKNFINDSYCRDISTKVKSQLDVKRKNGEYIASFAVYGYRKAENNKNQLVIDEYAAEIVKKIYEWKIGGMAAFAIAERLNKLGVLSPKEYKKSIGIHYNGGFPSTEKPLWSSIAVKRILTNEMYLGHMVQGKTEKINYKVKKWKSKPQKEWIKVENTHEAIISEDDFEIVQNLLKADGRVSPVTAENSIFAGILYCGDCKEQMVRRTVRYKDTKRTYYICSTKNRGEGCSRHSILEEDLKIIVTEAVKDYANLFLEKKKVFEKSKELETNLESVLRFNTEIVRLRQEKERYDSLCSGLYADLSDGVVTKEEFERLYEGFQRKAAEFEEAVKRQETLVKEVLRNGVISAGRLKVMQECAELKEIDRHTLCSLVKQILVFEEHRVEIEFYFMDQYQIMCEVCGQDGDDLKGIRLVGRGA